MDRRSGIQATMRATLLVLLGGMISFGCQPESSVDESSGPEESAPHVGTWELASVTFSDDETGADMQWGRGVLILGDGLFARQLVGSERPALTRGDVNTCSDEELRAIAAGYGSALGTYEPGADPDTYVFTGTSGLFAAEPQVIRMRVEGDVLYREDAGGAWASEWDRVVAEEPMDHGLVGWWKFERAENRPSPDSTWRPFFVGSTGYTVFDDVGTRVWDLTMPNRTAMTREAALDETSDPDALRALLRTYLVGLVDYEIDDTARVLTQVQNNGVFPGEGVRDWTYVATPDSIVITTAMNTFRATYKPWSG